MTTTRKIADIEIEIGQTPISLIRIYLQSRAVSACIARYESEVKESIACGIVTWLMPVPEVAGDLLDRIRYNPSYASLAAAVALQDVIKTHPDLAAATATLDPLYRELEVATQELAAETAAAYAAETARSEKMEAEKMAALSAIEAKFAIPPAPAAPEPPKLIRGRQPLASAPDRFAGRGCGP